MGEPDDWRIRNQETYLTNRSFYLHQYEPRSEKDDHAHCEFCWEKFSVYDGTSHIGYSTLDDMYWVCSQCYDDFKEMFSFHLWDQNNYKEHEMQHILNLEIGCSNGLENIYRVDRVLRLFPKLQQINTIQIKGKITPVIVNTSLSKGLSPHITIVYEGETVTCNGTISDFQTTILSLRQYLMDENKVEICYDNFYIRFNTIF